MKKFELQSMTNGWFVGDFSPTVYATDQFEVAVKRYKKEDSEEAHCHKVAIEMTMVVTGRIQMNGEVFQEGDIVVIEPGEYTDFTALTDTTTVVVKIPSVKGDKYVKPEAS